MEIIRSVEPIRGKTRITFDSGWQVWLSGKDRAPFPLQEGTEVDREELLSFIRVRQYPPALEKAVSMMAARACSRKEIETRLKRNHYDQEVIDLVLYKLEKEELLDDQEFSDLWVRSRMKKYGSVRIYHELRMKGVDPETAAAVLESCSEEDEMEKAVAFARKKIDSGKEHTDSRKLSQQVTGALVRKGFSWEIASKAYRKAMETENE